MENVFLTHRGGGGLGIGHMACSGQCVLWRTLLLLLSRSTGLLVVCENHKFLPGSDQCRGHFTHPKILSSNVASKILQDTLIHINSGKIANYYQELLDFGPLTHRKTKCETAQFQC